MGEAIIDDMWTPYKHLFEVVDFYLTSKSKDTSISSLQSILGKHKQNFINLLKNPPKNAKNRKEIKCGVKDGVNLPGRGHTYLLEQLVEETLILSDMYDLDEYIALELVCTAQLQMPRHPGLARGLVAVLLYYDGRKTLVSTLERLFQSRNGLTWSTEATPEIISCVNNFTDNLVEDGILYKVMDCLEELDISKELEKLVANRALGPPKHHLNVLKLFEEIQLSLASCLFNWSAQSGLPKNVTIRLINYLAKAKLSTESGGIDDITLALEMALLYAVDLSCFHRREDGEDIVRLLPIMNENGFIDAVLNALTTPWECEGLQAVIKFALGISIATLRITRQTMNINALNIADLDEQLVEEAIQSKVFDLLHYTLLENENIFLKEFYFRKIHILLTDFIELMYSKVTELRARADETAKTVQCHIEQGIDPPTKLCHNFEALLLAVGKLYENDQLKLGLAMEYWVPMDSSTPVNHQRTSRSVTLFKFIRLAGELLPQILFVPYLKMLGGLASCQQSARNVFNLLKQGAGISGSTTLSWDHFFNSLTRYYITLRQEQSPNTETVYKNRVLNRNIKPQELDGLHAVLYVIRAIATQDEVARIALCEHPSWSTLTVLTGLVTCSCVIPLKSDLLLTLAALAKSKETALQLWNILESSQIITTVPSTTTISTKGIESELEQIESRNETYPLTQAMLDLLYTLSSTAVPKNLGAGPRAPGLDPYLTFVLHSVFSRFYSRTYKDPAEKWVVAEKCLKLFELYIKSYDPNPNDFPNSRQVKEENSAPGFHIMLQMNKESDFLRIILNIIDEACNLIDSYAPFPGKAKLESCIYYAFTIIEKCLFNQSVFFDAHFAANCSIFLSGLNKLLLGINPRSGKPDHMLNIIKFVCYNNWLPKHAYFAIKILNYIVKQPNANSYLISVFTSDEKTKNEIRHGFVECLEADIPYNSRNEEYSVDEIELITKEVILNLLQDCLPQPAPNVAHYLLGFNLDDVHSTRFQQPGVLNFPSTCTKSIITLLDNSLEAMKNGQQFDPSYERLIANVYALLYALCLNIRTSESILRYLRTCNDFLCRHISALPFRNSTNPRILNQMTGLLKSVAIELKMSALNKQTTQFSNLCKILMGVSQNSLTDQINGTSFAFFPKNLTLNDASGLSHKPNDNGVELLICQLLDSMKFESKTLEMPNWDYFENSLMHSLFQSCLTATGGSSEPKLIDIKKLHEILRDELSTVQTTMAAGQRQLIIKEIELILKYALQWNTQKNACRSSVKFLEAWGQLTEILFCVAPSMTVDIKQGLIIKILQALLNKVVHVDTITEIANLAASTVLLLLVKLRHCYRFTSDETMNDGQSILNNNTTQDSLAFNANVNSLNLKYILKSIVEWIIVSGDTSQTLRINLYASFLNYMHIIKRRDENTTNDDIPTQNYVSRLDGSMRYIGTTQDDEIINQSELAAEVFLIFGDKLFEILCNDCTGGHDLCKMLAFSCIDMLLDVDSMSNFIHFISKRGYLSHLIDSLLKSDDKLCQILETTPENLKSLYIYESKMAMLSRVASSYIGAELLLEQKVLGVLSGMRVYDLHPDFQLNSFQTTFYEFVPPVDVRYRQILLPALNICDVIISTLGSENYSAISQILHFILSHCEMIEIILRPGTPFMNLGLLEELSAVTGLIARSTNQDIFSNFQPNYNLDVGTQLYRLQKLMLTLLPRFILSERTLNQMFARENITYEFNDVNKAKHTKLVFQIAFNLGLHARNSIANNAADHRIINILFSPNTSDLNEKSINIGTLKSSPNLGLVISQLKSCVEYYHKQHNSTYDKLRIQQEDIKLCSYLIEQCLYLLWTHVDYYMEKAVPVDNFLNLNSSFQKNSMLSSSGAGWQIVSDEVVALKKALVNLFNPTFCSQILTATRDPSGESNYSEALIRRIQRSVQFVPTK